ncbi:MAG: helix-turn-helix domain-containing protein [Phycisphaerae bacterium]|nr:helix-turn-helix domain-containing protein [Phycisphaerae bacterium]
MIEGGSRIQRLRKDRELSQADLANKAGISQAAISRIENSDELPSDIRVLSKLARVLGVALEDLTDGTSVELQDPRPAGDGFWAFCPNPFCEKNQISRSTTDQVAVKYLTYRQYPAEEFVNINFCPGCGTDLIKECAECKRRIDNAYAKYCTRCGSKVTNRPTKEEWKKIEQLLPPKPAPAPASPMADDDIPF